MKHTSGNWISDTSKTNGHCRVYRVFTGGKIVERTIASVRGTWMTEAEREANVSLIAAAPEMLSALENVLDALAWREQSLTLRERSAIKTAREAVAKAEQ